MEKENRKKYCRLCLIKYDRSILIKLFVANNAETAQLEDQLRIVLSFLEVSGVALTRNFLFSS